jgi:hypothetical protein
LTAAPAEPRQRALFSRLHEYFDLPQLGHEQLRDA